MKLIFVGLLSCIVLVASAVIFRLPLAFFVLTLEGTTPLSAPVALSPSESWFDDYYTTQEIAPDTYAIGEPRYYQQNYSYLLVGESRALLFDSGTPMRDITPVVASLTDLPVTVLASHLHYDHVGNHHRFDRIAMLDTPQTRSQAKQNLFHPGRSQHLGHLENFPAPTWEITDWLPDEGFFDLGGRSLQVFAAPGHTDQSVSLYDANTDLLFTGDFLYQGPLFAFLANSSLESYLATATMLRNKFSGETGLFVAHRATPPGAPTMQSTNLGDLVDTLAMIKSGALKADGFYPVTYRVNDEMTLMADLPWLQDWR